MTISWGVIIGILYLVAHIVAAIAKESAKRKEELRKREEAARRRGETVATATPTAGDSPVNVDPMLSTAKAPTAPQTVSPVRRGTPKDDLATRRREQIEQLRNRRQVRQGIPQGRVAGPGAEGAAGGAGGRMAEPLSQGTSSSTPGRDLMRDEGRRRREADEAKVRQGKLARAREHEMEVKERKERQQREKSFREAVRDESTSTQRETPVGQAHLKLHSGDPIAAINLRQGLLRQSIKSRLHQPASLREVLILKELLDKPLAMR